MRRSIPIWLLAICLTSCSALDSVIPPGDGSSGNGNKTVSDPKGDVLALQSLTPPSDLIGGVFDIDGSNLTVTLTFAPGTLSQASTGVTIYLDTDENRTTGFPTSGTQDANALGADFVVD